MSPVRLRIIIGIVILCSNLLILRYMFRGLPYVNQTFTIMFYSFTPEEIYNPGDFINLGFSDFELQQAKLRETDLEHKYDLTAVLLHWERLQGVQITLKHFLDAHLFKEIIIWNNNPQINLTVDQLLPNENSIKNIRIINSKENLKDEAKYRACAEANTSACFYADDDWNTSHYIKSLIASFRSDPNLLHSVTDPYTFYTNLVWSYFDTTIDLHTGFPWIGCGSVFLREHAERHLQLLHRYLKNDTDLIQLSDSFFSIWLNDIPVQMNANIRSQHFTSLQTALPFSSTPRFTYLQYTGSILAIRILERSLRMNRSNNSSDIMFPRQQNRRFPYYVKSPSFRDDFIFYSNVLPFQLQNVTFNISRDFERETRGNLPGGPHVNYFVSHNTWRAVDGDLATCWHSTRDIRSGDFYAIDLLQVKTNITFTLTVAHTSTLQTKLDVSVSFDGLWWISYRSLKGIYTKTTNKTAQQQLFTILFSSDEFALGFQSFRYIAFKAVDNFDHRFQVCELEIVSEKNMNDIFRGFQKLNT